MPATGDLRRLAAALDQVGEVNEVVELILTAVKGGNKNGHGCIKQAHWKGGQLSVQIENWQKFPAIVRSSPIPPELSKMLSDEAAFAVELATGTITSAPDKPKKAEEYGEVKISSKDAASLLRIAATLEEVSAACASGRVEIFSTDFEERTGRIAHRVCILASGTPHLLINPLSDTCLKGACTDNGWCSGSDNYRVPHHEYLAVNCMWSHYFATRNFWYTRRDKETECHQIGAYLRGIAVEVLTSEADRRLGKTEDVRKQITSEMGSKRLVVHSEWK